MLVQVAERPRARDAAISPPVDDAHSWVLELGEAITVFLVTEELDQLIALLAAARDEYAAR